MEYGVYVSLRKTSIAYEMCILVLNILHPSSLCYIPYPSVRSESGNCYISYRNQVTNLLHTSLEQHLLSRFQMQERRTNVARHAVGQHTSSLNSFSFSAKRKQRMKDTTKYMEPLHGVLVLLPLGNKNSSTTWRS